MTFKTEIKNLLKKHGRKQQWVAAQMNLSRVTFSDKLKSRHGCSPFTPDQESLIKKLIKDGK